MSDEAAAPDDAARDERMAGRVPMWAWIALEEKPPYQPGATATASVLAFGNALHAVPRARIEARVPGWLARAQALHPSVAEAYLREKADAYRLLAEANYLREDLFEHFDRTTGQDAGSRLRRAADEIHRAAALSVEHDARTPAPENPKGKPGRRHTSDPEETIRLWFELSVQEKFKKPNGDVHLERVYEEILTRQDGAPWPKQDGEDRREKGQSISIGTVRSRVRPFR